MAETSVGGTISYNTVWRAADSPFLVTKTLYVPFGVTLTIEAGTIVYMSTGTQFDIYGGLQAIGTAQAPIVFTSYKLNNNQAAAPGDWGRFSIGDVTGGSQLMDSVLEYVQIEYGRGVSIGGTAPVLNYVTIRNHNGVAIMTDTRSSPIGVGNLAIGNAVNAIWVWPGTTGDIVKDVTWGVRGIPYLIQQASVSVGKGPTFFAITPNTVKAGETIAATMRGARLAGLSNLAFSLGGLSAQVTSVTDYEAELLLTANNEATLGSANFSAMTDAGDVTGSKVLSVVAGDIAPVATGTSLPRKK